MHLDPIVQLVQSPVPMLHSALSEGTFQSARFRAHKFINVLDEFLDRIKQLLVQPDTISKIPEIHDFDTIGHQCLVRFRCMIQDNGYSKEFYPVPAESERTVTLKYHEHLLDNVDLNSNPSSSITEGNRLADKQPYFAVSIPAESWWLSQYYSQQADKHALTPQDNTNTPDLNSNGKRIIQEAKDKVSKPSTSFLKKRPLSTVSRSAIVKFYNDHNLSLEDVVEVVGIYERISSDHLPVIHAIFHRDLSLSGGHPLFKPCFFASDKNSVLAANQRLFNPNLEIVASLRHNLIEWLANEVLLGDRLMAELMVLWSLSRVQRRLGETAIGPLSMTISNVPIIGATDGDKAAINHSANHFAERMRQAMEILLPRTLLLPMSVDILNSSQFIPTLRDIDTDFLGDSNVIYENGYLDAGALQLSNGTSVIIDETSMTAGQLSQKGIQNLGALRELLTFYSLTYLNSNGLSAFQKDLQLLVIRSGTGSLMMQRQGEAGEPILPTDVSLPLQPQVPIPSELSSSLSVPEQVDMFRMYLAYYRIAGPEAHEYDLPDEIASVIEQEFVQSRQKNEDDPDKMSQDDLFKLLNIARLMSLSYGKMLLDFETWNKAKNFHSQLKRRTQ